MAHIEIKNLSFKYKTSEKNSLSDVSFTINKGDFVVLCGKSGCGKTTLINLLMRFYDPQGGKITIDGVNIEDMNREDLRKMYGMVLQDSWLFKGTIKENIAYGKTKASDEEIIEAAKAANAHNFIMNLADGYDTKIGERGITLSGGQRQRMAIARAILKNPRILILDEATSALDTESEEIVQEALDKLMVGRTSFVIAHRLSTIVHADKIVVLDNGRVQEMGTHQELMQTGGLYSHLYNIQFSNKKAK